MAARARGAAGGIIGTNETIANLRRFGVTMDKALLKLALITAVRVQATAVRSIQKGPKTGRVYGKRKHRASAPGQPPATDTGALASSVQRVDDKATTVAVGTGLGYGRDLEFGTRHIKARPWLFPALESQRRAYEAGLKQLGVKAMQELKAKGAQLKKLAKGE